MYDYSCKQLAQHATYGSSGVRRIQLMAGPGT